MSAADTAKAAPQPSERLINLLLAPHVSEKAARAGEKHNQYVFRVRRDATKPEIAKAVALMFSVEVEAVRVDAGTPSACCAAGRRWSSGRRRRAPA